MDVPLYRLREESQNNLRNNHKIKRMVTEAQMNARKGKEETAQQVDVYRRRTSCKKLRHIIYKTPSPSRVL